MAEQILVKTHLVDVSDLFIVDNGAGGTNRKVADFEELKHILVVEHNGNQSRHQITQTQQVKVYFDTTSGALTLTSHYLRVL